MYLYTTLGKSTYIGMYTGCHCYATVLLFDFVNLVFRYTALEKSSYIQGVPLLKSLSFPPGHRRNPSRAQTVQIRRRHRPHLGLPGENQRLHSSPIGQNPGGERGDDQNAGPV